MGESKSSSGELAIERESSSLTLGFLAAVGDSAAVGVSLRFDNRDAFLNEPDALLEFVESMLAEEY